MTIRQVLESGIRFRREAGDPAKRAYFNARTLERFETLEAVMLARRMNLRTANRRYRVHVGLDLRGA